MFLGESGTGHRGSTGDELPVGLPDGLFRLRHWRRQSVIASRLLVPAELRVQILQGYQPQYRPKSAERREPSVCQKLIELSGSVTAVAVGLYTLELVAETSLLADVESFFSDT